MGDGRGGHVESILQPVIPTLQERNGEGDRGTERKRETERENKVQSLQAFHGRHLPVSSFHLKWRMMGDLLVRWLVLMFERIRSTISCLGAAQLYSYFQHDMF